MVPRARSNGNQPLSKRIPRDCRRSARPVDVESRENCARQGAERGGQSGWSESHYEVRGRRREVIKGAFGRLRTVDMRMQRERERTVRSWE